MKNKNDGPACPKNFRRIVIKKACANCRYYDLNRGFTTCRRVTSINVKFLPENIFIFPDESFSYVCDGWRARNE